jgi:hypothetical protein
MGASVTRRVCLATFGVTGIVHLVGCAERVALPPVTHAPRPPARSRDPEREASDAALAEPDLPAGPLAPEPKVPSVPVLDLPPRAHDAETGSEFLERTEGLGRNAMDEAVEAAILAGNIPDHLRRLVPVEVVDDAGRKAILHVTCDYLAIGHDDAFVRMPMTSAAAQRLCNRLGTTLPTPKLVDAIYEQATVRLPPSWIDGGPTDGTLADYAVHNDKLEQRRKKNVAPLGSLVAGHKKDVVLCERMNEHPGKVAIYGWHERSGKVVQPLSTRHSCRYADYSHGIRLVDQHMTIDGRVHRVSDVLQHADLASILSADGALSGTEYDTVLPEWTGPSAGSSGKSKNKKKPGRRK